ncbi:MAG: oligoribonuclease [Candidatus Babeliales bacterium]
MNITNNLVWIDLEMTGLNPDQDVILEIACIVTDGQLAIIKEGPSLIIHQPEEKLKQMNTWSQEQHALSQLTQEVRNSTISVIQAEEQVLDFLQNYCERGAALLAGNSVWQDRIFLYRYMPRIIDFLYYRLIDVTTIKELVARWYPDNTQKEFIKKDTHRALSDIYESIEELKHYKKYFFI